MGQIVETYDYTDENGVLLYQSVRYEPKAFRQRRPDGKGGYVWSLNGHRRVVYRLPELLAAPLQDWVCLVEGEKDVASLRILGFVATTSGNASSWRPEFAEFFEGRLVAIFADNDDAGRRYARTVAESLHGVAGEVRIVELDGVGERGDITDWLEEHDSLEPAALKARINAMIEEAPAATFQTESTSSLSHGPRERQPIELPVPFPVTSLPERLARFVEGAARAIGCDPSYVALPLLAGLASAIGNTRRIELKRGWTEPAILWIAIVGDSGTLKSPALDVALRSVRRRQHTAIKQYEEAMARYEVERERYEKEHTIWKRSKSEDGDPPSKPEEPRLDRCWCDDTTIEALAVLLNQNPRGLLLIRDELAGWLGSFDRYSQGKGDAAKWLEMHGGRSIVVDRKTGPSKVTYVQRAAVSVTGGIQPAMLSRALGAEYRENGLAARLLFACPPRQPKRWTEAEIPPEMLEPIDRVFEKLYSLQLVTQGDEAKPLALPLTPEAKAAWIAFYNAHAEEQAELAGDLAAAWSKLEGYAARFALVVHLVRWAVPDATLDNPNIIDERSIEAGVQLSRWFGHEARRVYAILSETGEQRQQRRLIEMIQANDGIVTVRDVQRSSRKYRTAADAEQALSALVEAEVGRWEDQKPGPTGGHPVRRFVLTRGVDVDRTCRDGPVNKGIVNVSAVNTI